MGVPVLPPDVNESDVTFAVNKTGQIRFGLTAIKGVGEAAVIELIRERQDTGIFNGLYDLTRRVNLRSVNKKTLESLILAGALDSFGLNRSQYFAVAKNETANVIENAIKYGNNFTGNVVTSQNTLFGDSNDIEITEPKIPDFPEWNTIEKLKKEFEVIGIYLSGHPLDDFKIEVDAFKTCNINELEKFTDKGEVAIVGYIASTDTKIGKSGDNYQTDRNDPERNRFWVSDIQLLSEMREKKSMKITLNIALSSLNKEFIKSIDEVIKANPGKDRLVLKIVEETENFDVLFRTQTACVKADKPVLNTLGKFGDVSLKVAG